jgi:hypothetical protein
MHSFQPVVVQLDMGTQNVQLCSVWPNPIFPNHKTKQEGTFLMVNKLG